MAESNTIVVGIDGSKTSRSALRWAADEANRRGSEVVAVTAWAPVLPPVTSGDTAPHTAPSKPRDDAADELLQTIVDELGENPPVKVQPVVKEGNPARVLIDASGDADLLVVGTRGYGGFAGLLLGSVSQQVAAHADCTVVVVR